MRCRFADSKHNRADRFGFNRRCAKFLQTFDVVVSELFVERVLLAEEIKHKNPQVLAALLERLTQLEQAQQNKIQIDYVNHEIFKEQTHYSKAVVRSGECSPYANIILYSGVPF